MTLRVIRKLIKVLKLWPGKVALLALCLEGWIARRIGLRKLYLRHVEHLLANQSLFDDGYYLETNKDVGVMAILPIRHYVAFGDQEGRSPMPLFDPVYYRHQASGCLKGINSLLHFAWVGRYTGIATSPWFDTAYYLLNNKDVVRAGVNPLLHFVQWGGTEGRSPTPQFDAGYYLRTNPDVATSRMNPLLHYLSYGRLEGRKPCPPLGFSNEDSALGQIPVAVMPTDNDWHQINKLRYGPEPCVDVIVPVYKGRAETLRCIYSVLASANETAYELIVINDASPDPDLTEDLMLLAARGLFTLLVNQENCGFVGTVNRGMALHRKRDVLLLNSDTEVYSNWLDRLRRAAWRNPRTGTVTPLSNNATICSYPRFLHDNPYPLELSYADLDTLAATVNADFEVAAPTAVGFSMYIRRDCLDEVGLFDEEAFGKGYGEENDFSQRAIQHMWSNIIVGDVFVRHFGSASFQGEKSGRIAAAIKIIDKKYPRYQADVRDFVEHDPLHEARKRLDFARMERQSRHENVLLVCHNRGGGAERHVGEDTQRLIAAGCGVYYLRPVPGNPARVYLTHPASKSLPNIGDFLFSDAMELATVFSCLRLTRIHAHGLVDFTPEAPLHLAQLAQALSVPFWVDIHDYKVICPRINLIDKAGVYCGEPADERVCNQCLTKLGNDFGVRDIKQWRARHHEVLRMAERIFVPDSDVSKRLARYFPDVSVDVEPHDDTGPEYVSITKRQRGNDEKLRVVVIGAIGKTKGYEVLRACAQDAQARRLSIEYIVMGYTMDDALLQDVGVIITGIYLEHNSSALLKTLNPHVVLLPSVWPETYSYTLSIALRAGLPVSSFDIGAISNRLNDVNYVEGLMPLSWVKNPGKINNFLLAHY